MLLFWIISSNNVSLQGFSSLFFTSLQLVNLWITDTTDLVKFLYVKDSLIEVTFRHTHEGMRLSRECDAAEDGRVAIFSNPRGKRRLVLNVLID